MLHEDDDEGPEGLSVLQQGRARLLRRPCHTCVTFPDDRMHLGQRRTEFIDEARRSDSFVICHDTGSYAEPEAAICRGFWNLYRQDSRFCRFAEQYGLIVEVDPPVSGVVD